MIGNGEVCRICGSELISSVGMGVGCQKFYNEASDYVLKNLYKEEYYKMWGIRNDVFMNYLVKNQEEYRLEKIEKTKSYKKYAGLSDEEIEKIVDEKFFSKETFQGNVIKFYKEHGYVTYNQIKAITGNMAMYNGEAYEALNKEASKLMNLFKLNFEREHDKEIVDMTLKFIAKAKSARKNARVMSVVTGRKVAE